MRKAVSVPKCNPTSLAAISTGYDRPEGRRAVGSGILNAKTENRSAGDDHVRSDKSLESFTIQYPAMV
jgi:hypothetical protein